MENGHAPAVVTAGGGDKLADKLSGLKVNDDDHVNNDSLFQVMKAVEAAEATIKQQAEENTRLRAELQSSLQRLQKYVCSAFFFLLFFFNLNHLFVQLSLSF